MVTAPRLRGLRPRVLRALPRGPLTQRWWFRLLPAADIPREMLRPALSFRPSPVAVLEQLAVALPPVRSLGAPLVPLALNRALLRPPSRSSAPLTNVGLASMRSVAWRVPGRIPVALVGANAASSRRAVGGARGLLRCLRGPRPVARLPQLRFLPHRALRRAPRLPSDLLWVCSCLGIGVLLSPSAPSSLERGYLACCAAVFLNSCAAVFVGHALFF